MSLICLCRVARIRLTSAGPPRPDGGHPNAIDNPSPYNMLYIDASKLDFGVTYEQVL